MHENSRGGGILLGIAVFYAIGVVAVTIAAVTNTRAVGAQLAAVHGVPALAGLPACAISIGAGLLVIFGLVTLKRAAYWAIVGYMLYLLVVVPALVGKDASVFANVVWPLVMLVVLYVKRKDFGIGVTEGT